MKRYSWDDLVPFLRFIEVFLFYSVFFLSISGEEAGSFPSLVWKVVMMFTECSQTTTSLGQKPKLKMQRPRSFTKDQETANRLN